MTAQLVQKILNDINKEVLAQVEKWGVQRHPDGTSADYIDLSNFARERTDRKAEEGTLTWLDILEEEKWEAFAEDNDPDKLRKELVQTAAVIVSHIRDLDSR